MSELLLTLLRLGFLVLLWVMVLSVIGVLRTDIYGARLITRPAAPSSRRRRARAGGSETAQSSRTFTPAPRPTAPKAEPAPTRVLVTEGSARGQVINLGRDALTVGRAADCTLVLDDDFASSRHARLSPSPDGWLLEDLGSTNGTRLDGVPLESPAIVTAGATVQVGKTVLELRR